MRVKKKKGRSRTTGRRRRQKADTAMFSHCVSDFFVGISPMLCSLSISASVDLIRISS